MRGAAMGSTAAASGFVVFLLSVSGVQGQNGWGVTYTPTEICALKGSTVVIRCTYRYPSWINNHNTAVDETFWFTKESNGVYVDLRTDPEYTGRVQYHCYKTDCTLTITDLRERDSAVYKFRFTTNQGWNFIGSPGVTLTVTDLQVHVYISNLRSYSCTAELQCYSRCDLPDDTSYIWYKEGKPETWRTYKSFSYDFHYTDSYSCAVKGHETFPSPSVRVQGQNGWGVTYTPTEICVLKGSTLDIRCTYRYPSRINNVDTAVDKTLWFTKLSNKEPVDLRTDSEYTGRVQDLFNKNVCTLRITDLRERDSAEYKFRFITNQDGGRYSGSPGVFLTVTVDPGVQVQVRTSSSNSYSTWTELTCHSNCRLPVHPSYIWYKNELPTEERTAYFYPSQINPDDYYSCALSGYDSFRSPSVYAPKLPSVSVRPSAEIVEGSSVTLTCSSDANPAASYTWYKSTVSKVMTQGRQLVFSSIQSSDPGDYYCTAENQLGKRTSEYIVIDVKYAPKLPSVSVSPSAEIVEGSSVTLNCSSDANPAAKYTWYKDNQILQQGPEGIYYFTSISYKDRGFYHCKSMNDYGQINSSSHFIDVHYAPKLPSVSVSPSAEIVEGSSVTLTCSSDANPAASYTWYKGNQKLLSGQEGKYNFLSISSEDSGIYYCKSQNQYGQINSTSLFIDVWYAPKLPSVSVSPSAKIVEGSSVTLTCSSDANPAANYTWYKENEDSPKASGQIFTITDVRPEHSGNYYCEAQNRRGRQYSTLHLAVAAGAWKAIVTGTTTAVLLAIILFVVFLFIIKKWPFKQSSEPGKIVENRNEGQPEDQDDIYYASVKFSNNQADAIYSNVGPARLHRHEVEEEAVEYAAVKFTSVPRTSDQETEEDPAALYSTVNKTR